MKLVLFALLVVLATCYIVDARSQAPNKSLESSNDEALLDKAVSHMIHAHNHQSKHKFPDKPRDVNVLRRLIRFYSHKLHRTDPENIPKVQAQIRVLRRAIVVCQESSAESSELSGLGRKESSEASESSRKESSESSKRGESSEASEHSESSKRGESSETSEHSETSKGGESSEGSGFVNHHLDKFYNLVTALRTKRKGLAGLRPRQVKQLEIGVRALLLNIEKYNNEPIDAFPTAGLVVTATNAPPCQGSDACAPPPVVEAQAVQPQPEPELIHAQVVSQLPSCSVCYTARSTCENTCTQQASTNPCAPRKCAEEAEYCRSRCNDVVRVDLVKPVSKNNATVGSHRNSSNATAHHHHHHRANGTTPQKPNSTAPAAPTPAPKPATPAPAPKPATPAPAPAPATPAPAPKPATPAPAPAPKPATPAPAPAPKPAAPTAAAAPTVAKKF